MTRTPRLRNNFILLLAAFSLAMFLLVVVSIIAFYTLSGARAYVNGESQWTKAQKQAVIALFAYAHTGESERFADFEDALRVNHGDRQARLALSLEDPDYESAREGFLQGNNQPEDIELMMTLFVVGRDLPLFSDAIEAWTDADRLIARLEHEAEELRALVDQFGPGSAPVVDQLEIIKTVDRSLTRQEDLFSRAMGQLSNSLTTYSSIAVFLAAMILIAGAIILAWRLLKTSARRESALRESEQRYRALVDQPEVGMWQIDPHGHIVYFNPAMRSLLRIPEGTSLEGEPIERFIADHHRKKVRENRQLRERGKAMAMEVELTPISGKACIALVHGAPIRVGSAVVGHVGTCLDITARKQAEDELRFQALHDALTGLPNRKLHMDRLSMALKRSRRSGKSTAVFFIDLDRFKVVNDGLGHAAGDELLKQAAARLKTVTRAHDSIARFGGDEFGIILESIETPEEAGPPAKRILQAFEEEFTINGITARVGASVGIAVSHEGQEEAAELLRQADIAMYLAKRRGGGHVHFYDPEQDSFQQEHLHFESDLWNAAGRDELRLVYQPIVDLGTRRVESIEALVRWEHPDKGLLMPERFIALAEETGAISEIGQWVARRACLDFKQLKAELGSVCPGSVAINVSDAEFRFGDPVSYLHALCIEMDFDPDDLEIEVTESMLTQQPDALRKIRDQGHRIAIDDFGTGYASLDRLRMVPFDTIKIDRSFVAELTRSEIDRSIIEAVLQVGRRLRVQVVAEGIENEEDAQALLNMGCPFGQGYLFMKPKPLDELVTFISSSQSPES